MLPKENVFKILPIQNPVEQKACAEAVGTQVKIGYFGYAMRDYESDELMGFSQFELLGEEGRLSDLLPANGHEDFEAMFILGRQTLNFMEKCGAKTVNADKGSAEDSLLRAIGFIDLGDKYEIKVEGMFNGHCHNC